MAEALALASTVVALAQIAPMLNDISNLCFKLAGAAEEMRQLENELEKFKSLFDDVHSHARSLQESPVGHWEQRSLERIETEAKELQKTARALLEGLRRMNVAGRRNKARQLFEAIVFGIKKDEIQSIRDRLARGLQALQLMVQIFDSNLAVTAASEMREQLLGLKHGQEAIRKDIINLSGTCQGAMRIEEQSSNFTIPPDRDKPRLPSGETGQIALVYGSTQEGRLMLMDFLSKFGSRAFTCSAMNAFSNLEGAEWFLGHLYSLAGELLLGKYGIRSRDQVCWAQQSVTPRHGSDFYGARRKRHTFSETEISIAPASSHLRNPDAGVLIQATSLEFDGGRTVISTCALTCSRSGMGAMAGRLFSMPNSRESAMGIVVRAYSLSDAAIDTTRSLSTFNYHPSTATIFAEIKSGNVAAVRSLLLSGQVSPSDRDQDGESLLSHAISKGNIGMARLLILNGADTSDCNRYGDHALAIAIGSLGKSGFGLFRLLAQSTGALEAYRTERFKRRHGAQLSSIGLLHCALRQPSLTVDLLDLILTWEPDLEERDLNGNTPLLYSLFYLPLPKLCPVVNKLLRAGASPKATNNHHEGSLHLLLRRLTACNNERMPAQQRDSVAELLVLLLTSGCDPAMPNDVGYTPLDAAFSPVAWPIFSTALLKAGRSIALELEHSITAEGIVITEQEVKESLRHALTARSSARYPYPSDEKIFSTYTANANCELCGRGHDLYRRDYPFDEFRSTVVTSLGRPIHMIAVLHDEEECLRVYEEDTCHPLDYHPAEMASELVKKRILRRKTAYLLWRRGVLEEAASETAPMRCVSRRE